MYTTQKLYFMKQYTLDTGETARDLTGYGVMRDNEVATYNEPNPFAPVSTLMPEVWPNKMTAQKIADGLNGKVCELPKVHLTALKAAFKTTPSSFYPDWYHVSNKTSIYLCERLGLVTDWCEHNIMDSFTVAFDWRLQKWMVKA